MIDFHPPRLFDEYVIYGFLREDMIYCECDVVLIIVPLTRELSTIHTLFKNP